MTTLPTKFFNDDDVCSVCLEALIKDIHVACCKHAFHESCVKSINRCPLCRVSWKDNNSEEDEEEGDEDEVNGTFIESVHRHQDYLRFQEQEAALDALDPSRVARRLERARLEEERFRAEAELDRLNPNRRYLRTMATNYNMLRIMSGLGGLSYHN